MEYAVKIPVTVNIAIRVGGADNEGHAIDAAFRELPKILGKITPPHEPRTVDYEHVTVGMLPDGSPMAYCEHAALVGCLKEPVDPNKEPSPQQLKILDEFAEKFTQTPLDPDAARILEENLRDLI